jgi:hypothetical protein
MYCNNTDCPDYLATGKHGEYRDGISVCPYCGEPLQAGPPEPDHTDAAGHGPRMEHHPSPGADDVTGDLEPVFETSDPTEVPVVRSFLDAQGIPHVVIGEERFDTFRGALSPFRFNPRAGLVAFLVPSAYAEVARDLLQEMEDDPSRHED